MMHVNTLISAITAVLLGFQSAYGVASPQGSAEVGAGAAIPAFGYDVFQSAAGPISEGPVDDQYLLSAGDEIFASTDHALPGGLACSIDLINYV